MLTRELIATCGHRKILEHQHAELMLSAEQLDASRATALASKPPGCDETWIFGYGSLIWNPTVLFDERAWCTLDGWRRRFNIKLLLGRASDRSPGRMLSVEPGEGVVRGGFRLLKADANDEPRLLWFREMLTGLYTPTWTEVRLDDGRRRTVLVFAANLRHPFYETDDSVATIAPLIAAASGPFGTNADYVWRLKQALAATRSPDPAVEDLARALRELHDA